MQQYATRKRKRKKKYPVIIESGIPIRVLPHRPKRPYMLDIARGGTRRRLCFATEQEARHAALREAGNLMHEGLQAVALDRDQRQDAVRAIRLLGGTATLEAAAEFYMRHTVAGEQGKPSREVIADLIASKKAANRRPDTVADAASRLNRFAETFGERPLGTITLHELERWLAELCVGPVSRDNYRRAVVGLFNYGNRRGLCHRNPAAGIPRSGRDQSMPEILTPLQVEALLNAAAKCSPDMVPYFAIGLFSGLRPKNELARLDWRNIDFKSKTLRVDPATAKRRRMRFVTIASCLAAWLAPYRQASGLIFYSRRHFRRVVTEAKLATWPPDVMRHTFATYHLAAHEDANATALQLGHAGAPGVLFDHYRAIAKPGDARAFWKVMPKAHKVVTFPQASAVKEAK